MGTINEYIDIISSQGRCSRGFIFTPPPSPWENLFAEKARW